MQGIIDRPLLDALLTTDDGPQQRAGILGDVRDKGMRESGENLVRTDRVVWHKQAPGTSADARHPVYFLLLQSPTNTSYALTMGRPTHQS